LTEKVEHVLKAWEKEYGYLGLSKEELELFAPVIGKRFTMKILGREYYERKIDQKQRRIWVSHGALAGLEAGDVLIIGRDEDGNYYVEKKT